MSRVKRLGNCGRERLLLRGKAAAHLDRRHTLLCRSSLLPSYLEVSCAGRSQTRTFSHENIGQLNTYVSWYDKNVRCADDNPHIGILHCAVHDHALVEYALAGMENALFVSKYQLQLPDHKVHQGTPSPNDGKRNRNP